MSVRSRNNLEFDKNPGHYKAEKMKVLDKLIKNSELLTGLI